MITGLAISARGVSELSFNFTFFGGKKKKKTRIEQFVIAARGVGRVHDCYCRHATMQDYYRCTILLPRQRYCRLNPAAATILVCSFTTVKMLVRTRHVRGLFSVTRPPPNYYS